MICFRGVIADLQEWRWNVVIGYYCNAPFVCKIDYNWKAELV